jgi:hypothetical protein
MKINKVINTIEKYNKIVNELEPNIELKEIPVNLLVKAKAQNDILNNMYNEFNIDTNSYIYKFSNTDNPRVKNINFEKPLFIKEALITVNNFIYDKLVKFKITFYTIDNSSVTYYMLPYEFRGDYIEEIKFSFGQDRSNFKTINNDKFLFYDIIKNSEGDISLQKTNIDYHETIDEEGYIIFNTTHKKDKLVIKYTPISSEFKKIINDKITSVTLELDNDISNEIILSVKNK